MKPDQYSMRGRIDAAHALVLSSQSNGDSTHSGSGGGRSRIRLLFHFNDCRLQLIR